VTNVCHLTGKGKFVPVYVVKAYRESRGIAPLCYLNTSCISHCDRREKKDSILEQYIGNAKNYLQVLLCC